MATRLSIVVPMQGDAQRLERGLVSLLANRPPATEVLVVLNHDYDDPYHLSDEVRFVQAPRQASVTDGLNLALAECEGEVVHVLACGAEVTEGWTDPALRHFDDPGVSAVAPKVMDLQQPQSALAASVSYQVGGARQVRVRGADSGEGDLAPASVLGPTLRAGFYRKSVLDQLGGFAKCFADVDLALRMRVLGFHAVFEPGSVVLADRGADCRRGFWYGLRAERLFWRHALFTAWWKSLLAHPFVAAQEIARCLPDLRSAAGQLLGRAIAGLGAPARLRRGVHWRQQGEEMLNARRNAEAPRDSSGRGRRIDEAHRPADRPRVNQQIQTAQASGR